jgi:hypothetical protein
MPRSSAAFTSEENFDVSSDGKSSYSQIEVKFGNKGDAMTNHAFIGLLIFTGVLVNHFSSAAHAAEQLPNTSEECSKTIHLLQSKLDLLSARIKNPTKTFKGDDTQSAQVEKRIETAIEDFIQEAKNWRTKWDFFNKSRDDENLNELAKRITKELSAALPGTQIEMTQRPERTSTNGNESFVIQYLITYPTSETKLMHDSARLKIEAVNLRVKFVSFRDEKPELKFSFLPGLDTSTAALFSPEDKAYFAGLQAAIAALSKNCVASVPVHR